GAVSRIHHHHRPRPPAQGPGGFFLKRQVKGGHHVPASPAPARDQPPREQPRRARPAREVGVERCFQPGLAEPRMPVADGMRQRIRAHEDPLWTVLHPPGHAQRFSPSRVDSSWLYLSFEPCPPEVSGMGGTERPRHPAPIRRPERQGGKEGRHRSPDPLQALLHTAPVPSPGRAAAYAARVQLYTKPSCRNEATRELPP